MSNNYFQFKEFTINQQHCAMKVCTDACLFGAVAASDILDYNTILDIGSGTGLLSIMLAQKSTAQIDTVEIDQAAYEQAKENIEQSPWNKRIAIYNENISNFESQNKYDFIISNPPFFEDNLKSDDGKKNAAKHDSTLTLKVLLENINRLLISEGNFAVLIPFHRSQYFEAAAASLHFNLVHNISVKQTTTHPFFRSILFFSRKPGVEKKTVIAIKNEQGAYSEAFIALLKDYYLYL